MTLLVNAFQTMWKDLVFLLEGTVGSAELGGLGAVTSMSLSLVTLSLFFWIGLKVVPVFFKACTTISFALMGELGR